jgi:PAS domain S-box-containing protein
MPQILTKTKESPEAARLREKAEELLLIKKAGKPVMEYEGDIRKLVHELEVHQIELEIQNDELRLALENAALASEKYAALYDSAPAGYFTLDQDGVVTNINLSGAKMLGMEKSKVVNYLLTNFVSYDDKETFQNFVKNIFGSGLKQTCEVQMDICADQSCFVYLEGIRSDDQNFCFLTAIDTTRRHWAEQALKESESQLKVLNATKDKFFSIIAHDLRNPFTSITGFSSLLLNQSDKRRTKDINKYSKIIYDSSLRAMNLLKNLMEWARLQTGKMAFNPKPVEITNIITSVIELLSDGAGQKSITIVRETDPGIIVFADEEMISTIMRNLLSNAIKFTKPGGEVTISVHMKPEELIVAVCDNGIGMDKDRLDKLFRIDESISTRGTQSEEGTGLGLILCREFVLRHCGNIWVESTLGVGSKFLFSIPNEVKDKG